MRLLWIQFTIPIITKRNSSRFCLIFASHYTVFARLNKFCRLLRTHLSLTSGSDIKSRGPAQCWQCWQCKPTSTACKDLVLITTTTPTMAVLCDVCNSLAEVHIPVASAVFTGFAPSHTSPHPSSPHPRTSPLIQQPMNCCRELG